MQELRELHQAVVAEKRDIKKVNIFMHQSQVARQKLDGIAKQDMYAQFVENQVEQKVNDFVVEADAIEIPV